MQAVLTGIARRIASATTIDEALAVDIEVHNIREMLRQHHDATAAALMRQLSDIRDDYRTRDAALKNLEDDAQARVRSFRPKQEEAA